MLFFNPLTLALSRKERGLKPFCVSPDLVHLGHAQLHGQDQGILPAVGGWIIALPSTHFVEPEASVEINGRDIRGPHFEKENLRGASTRHPEEMLEHLPAQSHPLDLRPDTEIEKMRFPRG